MNRPSIRVIKVGGSLFDFAELPTALNRWLDLQTAATNVFIAGGGNLVDTIRRADDLFQLGDETSHWLSIRLMDVNAGILNEILRLEIVTSFESLKARTQSKTVREPIIFCVEGFLRESEAQFGGGPLPQNWTVTSDSISARVAECIGAHELVLLKSTFEPIRSLDDAVTSGLADRHFRIAAASIPIVRFVDLRSDDFRESRWPINE